SPVHADVLARAIRDGRWMGRASQLSEDHVVWTFIDEIARATEDSGRAVSAFSFGETSPAPPASGFGEASPARKVIIQRRSGLALDGHSPIDRARFRAMLARTLPGPHAPWDAMWWDARIHLALFVHRVIDVAAGLYVLVRDPRALDRLRTACGREFPWTR